MSSWSPARIAEAVISAFHSLHAAELGDGIGHEPSISFNRRFLMRNGRQATHPGKGNPDIVKPAGPIDPDVGVLAARAPGGDLLGLFVNFACHLTVMGGNGFTADYVYHLRETLRRHYKKPAPAGRVPAGGGRRRDPGRQPAAGPRVRRRMGQHVRPGPGRRGHSDRRPA